jgi:predicted nuclease of restriction endonuclease-like (RecB) superfamily
LTALIAKVKDPDAIEWCAQQVQHHGWSRAQMLAQVRSDARGRAGAAPNNFTGTLEPTAAAAAQATIKDPVTLGFLGVTEQVAELELEHLLVKQVQQFMVELGYGLAYIGRQHRLVVGGQDFYIALLFFNYVTVQFVVVELKVEDYKPEFAGKVNFYVNAVDDQLVIKGTHGPTVGIILVPGRNDTIVDMSLPGHKPIAVATYALDRIPAARAVRDLAQRALTAGDSLLA